MITTITLNPCIDKTVAIDTFEYGGLNRIKDSRKDIGGKGINVAAAYTNLGGEALCSGFNYLIGGDYIHNKLDDMHIRHDFVMVPGELRVNLKVFDEGRAVITELNEKGWPVHPDSVAALKDKVKKYCGCSSAMVFSGSVPEGISSDIYGKLMQECDAPQCKLILDAEGQLFLEGLKARPYLVKPNRFELENALGIELNKNRDVARGAEKLLEYGVQIVCVSLGPDGAVIVDSNDAFYAPALPVKVKSTVGAGDSMVAALCLAIEQGKSLGEMLRMAAAAAAATIMTEGTQFCSKGDYETLLPQVALYRL
jgi:1-phosphofructokinase